MVSRQSKTVSAPVSGVKAQSVLVQVGDIVSEGQTLIVFDMTDIEESLAEAEKSLSVSTQQASISAQNAKRNVDDAKRTESYQVDQAAKNRDDARRSYEDACRDYDAAIDALDQLEDDEETAKANYERAAEACAAANQALVKKQAAMESANTDMVSSGDVADKDGYIKALEEYNAAKAAYDSALAKQNAAKTAYDALTQSRRAKETEANNLAQQRDKFLENYNNLARSYENTVAGQASSVQAAVNSQKSSALASNTDAEKKRVRQYQAQLENGSVSAPINGVVTAVNIEEGDTYNQGALVTIQDCSSYEIEAEIGEYDISDIAIGQKVLIKTEATRDEELEGTVLFISPTATKGGSGVTYTVRISIDTASERLRLDMSANLSIIIREHPNALIVPYNAVQTDDEGNTYVEVCAEDGTVSKVWITVLLESNYYTEVESDELWDGQRVIVVTEHETNPFEAMRQGGGF